MSHTGTIKIPVLFDMSGDTIVYGEDVTGDFVTSHLDFILDMTTEANDISLNAADISAAVLVGDQDNTDNLFYSGGSSGNIAVDKLCNRIAKAITRGKLVHIPKSGNHSNSGIPLGGRAELVDATGTHTVYHIQNVCTPKYFTSIAPIGDEQMLGEAMARVASIHLVGTPLAAAAFENKNSVQTYLETASAQTFNSGNTAFYNALAVQLSKVLGGSKSSAPMKNGSYTIPSGNNPNPSTEYNLTAIYDSHLDTLVYSSADFTINSHVVFNGVYLSTVNSTTYNYTTLSGYNATSGAYEGSHTTTVGGVSTGGAWFQVDCGVDVWINRWELSSSGANATKDSIIAYSLDGSTWSELVDTSTTDTAANLVLSGTLSAKVKGRYFRWILKTTNAAASAKVRYFNLFGQTDAHHTDTALAYGTTAPQQIGYVHFNDENASLPTGSPAAYITGHDGTGKALSTIGQTHAQLGALDTAPYVQTTSDVLPAGAKALSFWCKIDGEGKFLTQLLFRITFPGNDNAITLHWFYGTIIMGSPGVIPIFFIDGRRFYFESGASSANDSSQHGYTNTSRPWPLRDGNWHHLYLSWTQELPTGHSGYKDLSNYSPTQIEWMGTDGNSSNFSSSYNCPCAIDEIRFFSAPLTPIQIHDYYIGNDGTQNGNALPVPYILSNENSYPTLTRTLTRSSGDNDISIMKPSLWGVGWSSAGSKYNATTGEYEGTETTGGYTGEWVQIDFGEVVTGVYAQISPGWAYSYAGPNTFRFLYSLDGTNWTTWFDIVNHDTDSWRLPPRSNTILASYFTARNPVEMRYVRLIINKENPNTSTTAMALMNIYGYNAFDKADAAATALNAIPPNDADGTSVPALKSIYEQLMSVPGRSQIMETREITNVPMPSGKTKTGGFPFIAGDKLVMYLRPKIVFAAQTKAEQSTSLITFSEGITLNTPVFNVGRDGQGITGQSYDQSDYYSNQAAYKGEKAFDGTVTGGYGWLANNPFDNTTGAYNANPPSNTSVDGVNLAGSWTQVNIGKKVAVTSYKIYPQDWEKPSIGGRSPHIFKLVYSDDGTNFFTADSQTVGTDNQDTSEWASDNTNSATYIPKTFTLTETKIGQYWRLIVTSVYGNNLSNGGALAVQELEIKGTDDYTEPGGSLGMDLSGVQTNIVATAENIEDAFPGNATTGPVPEMNKWGWMGSPSSDSLTLETTDVTDIRTIDLHIWKITITL